MKLSQMAEALAALRVFDGESMVSGALCARAGRIQDGDAFNRLLEEFS